MTKLLTAAEIADNLQVSVKTVRDWFHKGNIPGTILPGGDMRFSESDIEKWIKNRTVTKKKTALI